METRYSIITGFLGRLQDRFTSYQTERNLRGKMELASRIKGAEGVELIYPSDFEKPKITNYRLRLLT